MHKLLKMDIVDVIKNLKVYLYQHLNCDLKIKHFYKKLYKMLKRSIKLPQSVKHKCKFKYIY